MNGQEHLDDSFSAGQEIIWLIKDTMPQTCSGKHTYKAIKGLRVKLLFRYPLLFV